MPNNRLGYHEDTSSRAEVRYGPQARRDHDSTRGYNDILSQLHARDSNTCNRPRRSSTTTTTLNGIAVPTKIDSSSDSTCSICLEEYSEIHSQGHLPMKIRICGHIFGAKCIRRWLGSSTTCPMCRRQLNALPRSPTFADLYSTVIHPSPSDLIRGSAITTPQLTPLRFTRSRSRLSVEIVAIGLFPGDGAIHGRFIDVFASRTYFPPENPVVWAALSYVMTRAMREICERST
ncbi:unnamed protein product [Periconia digitata]|uniref:RING-type domain-containing protein n=1 Tax=Periconia digitata TaxID=1303443 RepID=A0A9W4XG02_9PLEO|nr:unnamed protein product [Periconia digitata]